MPEKKILIVEVPSQKSVREGTLSNRYVGRYSEKRHGHGAVTMRIRQLIQLASCGGALLASTAYSIDSPPALIECIPSRVYHCVSNTDDCDSMPVSNVQGTYILKINLPEKRSETFSDEQKVAETRIDRIQQNEQLLFLYGFELHENEQVSVHSWNAIINLHNGGLTVTRVADGVGAVMHGHCKIGKGGTQ
jgi:hypothetical protein